MKVRIEVTRDQADAILAALDLYSRVCMGQLEEIAHMIRMGRITPAIPTDDTWRFVDIAEGVERALRQAKVLMGHTPNGHFGIGHDKVGVVARRCYELQKVIDRALALHHNPNPAFTDVRYDGLTVRYTDDPEPVVEVVEDHIVDANKMVPCRVEQELFGGEVRLYTAPQKPEWIGLMDEEISECWDSAMDRDVYTKRNVYESIEAKLKEKNHE